MAAPPMPTSPEASGVLALPGRPPRRIVSPWTVAFLIAAAITFLAVLSLGRNASFWADEWKLIDERLPWTLDAFLAPLWEHPVVAQVLLWKVLMETVGLSSYLPYLALTALAHVILAAGVYRIVRGLAGAPVAFAAGLVMLLLGSGGQAILLAMSLNLTGAAAAGIWALALFLEGPSRRGQVAVTLLLLLSVAFSGAVLFFIAAIGATALLVPGRRRELVTLIPAAVAFLAWRLRYGGGFGAGTIQASPEQVVAFVTTGVGHAMGALTGLGDEVGLVLVVLLIVATVWHLLGRRPLMVAAVAGLVGLLATYGITALARAQIVDADGNTLADASRYGYLGAPWLLIACCSWLALRPTIDGRSARQLLPIGAVLFVILATNGRQLVHWGRFVADQGDQVRAAMVVLQSYGGSPALPADVPAPAPPGTFLMRIPAPARLAQIVAQVGSPTDPDPFNPGRPAVPAATMERILVGYVADAFQAAPIDGMPAAARAPIVRTTSGVTTSPDDACLLATPVGPSPSLVVEAAGGGTLALTATSGSTIGASISADGSFSTPSTRTFDPSVGAGTLITLPDLGASWPWLVRLDLGAAPVRICVTDPTG